MIQQAIAALLEEGKKDAAIAATAKIITIAGEHKRVFRRYEVEGGISDPQNIVPPPQTFAGETIGDIADAACSGRFGSHPVIFVSSHQVVLAKNADDIAGDDAMQLELTPTDIFQAFVGFNGVTGCGMEQEYLRSLLIGPWHESQPDDRLLKQISSLNFSAVDDSGKTIDHGKSSYGNKITEQATAGSTDYGLPDEVQRFTIRACQNADVPTVGVVRCTLRLDLRKRMFILTPFRDHLAQLRARVVDDVVSLLKRTMDAIQGPEPADGAGDGTDRVYPRIVRAMCRG